MQTTTVAHVTNMHDTWARTYQKGKGEPEVW